MQLQRDDQEAKIRELKRKQLEFYKKQKVCETFATLTVISSFASMFHASKVFYHHLMDMRFFEIFLELLFADNGQCSVTD